MKYSYFILCMLPFLVFTHRSVASSEPINPLVTLRYEIQQNSSDLGYAVNTAISPGDSSITRSGYLNYVNVSTISGTSKNIFHASGNGSFSLADTDGLKADGKNIFSTATGFTLVFNGYASTGNWGDFLSFTVGSESYKFETTASTSVALYQSLGSDKVTEKGQVSGITRQTWYQFSLTALNTNYTFSAWNSSGNLVSSLNFTGTEGHLTKIYEGADFSRHYYGNYLDNIGLYDGVLTDAQLSQLVLSEAAGNGMIQQFSSPIPEPTTASLSLLSLAGLIVCRRRK